jgi:hypothetical protein
VVSTRGPLSIIRWKFEDTIQDIPATVRPIHLEDEPRSSGYLAPAVAINFEAGKFKYEITLTSAIVPLGHGPACPVCRK